MENGFRPTFDDSILDGALVLEGLSAVRGPQRALQGGLAAPCMPHVLPTAG